MKTIALHTLSFLLLILSSCNSDDRMENTPSELNINGNWKIDHYEIKGKNYQVSGCDVSDQININTDKTGSYIDSEINSATNGCYQSANIAGRWEYKSNSNALELLNVNSSSTLKSFQVDAISNSEIRIVNPSKTISGVPATEQVVEVWVKR